MAAFPAIENPVSSTSGTTAGTSGGVPFEYLFDGYQAETIERVSNSLIMARVAWDDANDFLYDALGYTSGVAGSGSTTYQRTLPLQSPFKVDEWLTRASLVSYPSSSLENANQDDELGFGGFSTDWAIYALTFARRPYFVVSDDLVSSFTIPELYRYCTISERPRAREFSINSFSLFVEGTVAPNQVFLNTPAFVMDREQDLVITQHQVPADCYPYTAIDNCLGRINETEIRLPVSYLGNGTYVTRTYAAQTLLFRGVANEITKYPGPLGDTKNPFWYVDLPLVFTYRPNGWRKLPRPDSDGAYVNVLRNGITPDGQSEYLYRTEEFADMFKPI